MRVTNQLHFTENHRFIVYRDFAMGALHGKMLSSVYQPMVGACAIGLYMALIHQIAADKAGFSPPEQQRKLFLTLAIEPGEKGRKSFIEMTSRLEAVGLLQTTRKFIQTSEEYIYEYRLLEPLNPGEFFKTQHLLLLLRDNIGKHAVLHLSRELLEPEPEELHNASEESLTVPFYELFRLNTSVIDHELEQVFYEMAPARLSSTASDDAARQGFQYSEIIMRFPRGSRNRSWVEGLKHRPEELARLNYVAQKYGLKLQEVCRLLDEDDLFDEDGSLQIEPLQYKANLHFRQERKREEERIRYASRASGETRESDGNSPDFKEEKPVEMAFYLEVPALFQGQCDIHQYNMLMRNEPYTLVLKRFFSKGRIPDGVLDIFEKIDLTYGLSEEVINVLIHFLHVDRRSWSKTSIEYVASDMLGKQVSSYEQAVQYIREQLEYKEKAAAKSTKKTAGRSARGQGTSKKPNIPIIEPAQEDAPPTEEEFEAMRRKALKLDGKIK